MRATTQIRRALQGVLFFTLAQFAAGALAQEYFSPWGVADDEHTRWICEYSREPDGVLYMRCDDLLSLMFDGLVQEGDAQPSPSKLIPLWGAPRNEANALGLAEMMLCNRQAACSVQLAARYEEPAFARF